VAKHRFEPSRYHPTLGSHEPVLAVGNARPLDKATRHATTEMTRWLVEGFGFDPIGARILLGQVVEDEIGNFYNPAYTVVCKVPKRYLG